MDTQSKRNQLIQKIMERCFPKKEQRDSRIKELREYAKHGKRESVSILSEALKKELLEYAKHRKKESVR